MNVQTLSLLALSITLLAQDQPWPPAIAADPPLLQEGSKLPADAQVAVSASQAIRALTPRASLGSERLQANPEISRGAGALAYRKAAPACVLIQAANGFGTGFLVSEDGWIVTNHHVIEVSHVMAPKGCRLVKVYLGQMQGHIMEIDETAIVALVYKTSPEKDLALLKLTKLPEGCTSLPKVTLADEVPAPGVECAILGHPRAGMLWTVRGGEIAGAGWWPQDLLHSVKARLSASKQDAQRLNETLASASKRKVLISSCGCNPGDSGGPLLNPEGEVIGVNFAIPGGGGDEGISLDKFSYHLHLDELRAFIKDRPAEPEPFIPDAWPAATVSALRDLNKDKIWDTLAFSTARDQPTTAYLVDLDQDTPADFDHAKLSDPKVRASWDFEFGLHMTSIAYTFYDKDNDGQIDVILTDADKDKMADIVLRYDEGVWQATNAKGAAMFAPEIFEDEQLRQLYIERFGLPVHERPERPERPEQPVQPEPTAEPAENVTPEAPSEPEA